MEKNKLRIIEDMLFDLITSEYSPELEDAWLIIYGECLKEEKRNEKSEKC